MNLQEIYRKWSEDRASGQEVSRREELSQSAGYDIRVADGPGNNPYVYVHGVRLFRIAETSDVKQRTIGLADVPDFLKQLRDEYVEAGMKSGDMPGK